MNGSDDLGAHNSVKIDKKLLVDVNQLAIGPMISEGTYSIVYEGLYRSVPVAVKVIQPDMSAIVSLELQEKFTREVSMLSRVNHDNIVKLIGITVEPKMMIITELMKEDKKKIKLADFGLAREESDDEMTTEAGTYRWMAPELFSVEAIRWGVKKHYDHKVDVYSFSMVLWELLTNRTPFKGLNNIMVAYAAAMNRRPSMDNIPAQIAPLLQSCWAENPEERPEFHQITKFLEKFLRSICQREAQPSLLKAEYSRSNEENEISPATDRLMNRPKKRTKRNSTRVWLRFFGRFGHCL
ncbi:serine/threonine-protein kinase ht1 [Phtheirospermum japonicum]|uniref:Serine/threonine-protein kinase ht1 n=1 Tax=Phtheirospermum japonicum TaxID=374723 RepID=A0A830BBK1_9LAMI|nr:serine/threonine-protein kinase ht1 [Phtheirospermum japonicum]